MEASKVTTLTAAIAAAFTTCEPPQGSIPRGGIITGEPA